MKKTRSRKSRDTVPLNLKLRGRGFLIFESYHPCIPLSDCSNFCSTFPLKLTGIFSQIFFLESAFFEGFVLLKVNSVEYTVMLQHAVVHKI
jgi:hypothetical protein